MRLEDLVDLRVERPMEFGYEKELLLQAKARADGTLFNLDLGAEYIADVHPLSGNPAHTVTVEYSRCLLEIVSKPYPAHEAADGLAAINEAADSIETSLREYVRAAHPRIEEAYTVHVSEAGSSPSSLYLRPDRSIGSDLDAPEHEALLEYRERVSRYRDVMWTVGSRAERIIGIYNHINSFHITFHPTYVLSESVLDRFMFALRVAEVAARAYAPRDKGNRELVREESTVRFDRNVRDAFLEEFITHKEVPLRPLFPASSTLQETELQFFGFAASLLKRAGTDDLDRAFSSWSSINIRPRILPGDIPGVELRQFGSGFSRTAHAQALIGELIQFDVHRYAQHSPTPADRHK